jgi:hypothetical protein
VPIKPGTPNYGNYMCAINYYEKRMLTYSDKTLIPDFTLVFHKKLSFKLGTGENI